MQVLTSRITALRHTFLRFEGQWHFLCVLALAVFLPSIGCGPSVNAEATEGGEDEDETEYHTWTGRYGVYFAGDETPLFVGDVVLRDGGIGEFIPEWVCDEGMRIPLNWELEEEEEGGLHFELAVEGLPPEQELLISGTLDGCFSEPLEGRFGMLERRVILLPNEGYCLDEISDGEGSWSEQGCLVEACDGLELPEACVGA